MIPVSKPLNSTTDLTFATFLRGCSFGFFLWGGGCRLACLPHGFSPEGDCGAFSPHEWAQRKKQVPCIRTTQVTARLYAFLWFTTTRRHHSPLAWVRMQRAMFIFFLFATPGAGKIFVFPSFATRNHYMWYRRPQDSRLRNVQPMIPSTSMKSVSRDKRTWDTRVNSISSRNLYISQAN